jgi:enoyl-CoA hydratase
MEFIHFYKENHVATILLKHQPANALSSSVLKEISEVLDKLENDDEAKVIVVRGEGRFFSAGADIKEFTTVNSGDQFAELGAYGRDLFDRIENFHKPIIAAIHGAALGGGLELAMACHIRFVTTSAKLGLPELTLGLIPGFAGTQRLPRLVGVPKATEMLLSSEPISGEEAVKVGLANKAFSDEDLFEYAYSYAQNVVQKSRVTVKFILNLLKYARDGKFQEGAIKETQLFGEAFSSVDGQEGIKAFIEKRKPLFKDC